MEGEGEAGKCTPENELFTRYSKMREIGEGNGN